MKCDRCNTEMTLGIAIPSPEEGVFYDPGLYPISWPFDFQKVLKCSNCGRSYSQREIDRKKHDN